MKALSLMVVGFSAFAQAPVLTPAEQAWDDVSAEELRPLVWKTISSVASFESDLAPHGDWLMVHRVLAFRPRRGLVGADFVPYASPGNWVWTAAGWSFSSPLPFGWATFHYGRWWLDPTYGWVWVPDTVWGPSWVAWRSGGGYTGWTPLPPPAFAQQYHRPRWYFVDTRSLGSTGAARGEITAAGFESALRATESVTVASGQGAGGVETSARREARLAPVAARRGRGAQVADLLAPPPAGY